MDTRNYYTVAGAARRCDLARTTLQSAVDRGSVPSQRTADDMPLVLLEDVRRFAANRPKRGRPFREPSEAKS